MAPQGSQRVEPQLQERPIGSGIAQLGGYRAALSKGHPVGIQPTAKSEQERSPKQRGITTGKGTGRGKPHGLVPYHGPDTFLAWFHLVHPCPCGTVFIISIKHTRKQGLRGIKYRSLLHCLWGIESIWFSKPHLLKKELGSGKGAPEVSLALVRCVSWGVGSSQWQWADFGGALMQEETGTQGRLLSTELIWIDGLGRYYGRLQHAKQAVFLWHTCGHQVNKAGLFNESRWGLVFRSRS